MTRKFKLFVKMTRLPDVEEHVQFGINISGAIVRKGTSRAEKVHSNYLTPWKWKEFQGTSDWNPHHEKAWQVYYLKDGTYHEIADWELIDTANTNNNWIKALDKRVKNCTKDDFDPATLEELAENTPSSRNVHAFVETLPNMPSPYPSVSKVWFAIQIDKNIIYKDCRIIAVPKFNVDQYDYESSIDRIKNKLQLKTTHIQGLKAILENEPAPYNSYKDDKDLGIQLSTYLIEPEDNINIYDEDNSIGLVQRIAESCDPTYHIMNKLEIEMDTEEGREFLEDTASNKQELLKLIDALHWYFLNPYFKSAENEYPFFASILKSRFIDDPFRSAAGYVLASLAEDQLFYKHLILPEKFNISSLNQLRSWAGINPDYDLIQNDTTLDNPTKIKDFLFDLVFSLEGKNKQSFSTVKERKLFFETLSGFDTKDFITLRKPLYTQSFLNLVDYVTTFPRLVWNIEATSGFGAHFKLTDALGEVIQLEIKVDSAKKFQCELYFTKTNDKIYVHLDSDHVIGKPKKELSASFINGDCLLSIICKDGNDGKNIVFSLEPHDRDKPLIGALKKQISDRVTTEVFYNAMLRRHSSPYIIPILKSSDIKTGFEELIDQIYSVNKKGLLKSLLALAGVNNTTSDAYKLFKKSFDEGLIEAKKQASQLFTPQQQGKRLAQQAQPLVIPFANFGSEEIPWEELSGMGLMIGRAKNTQETAPDGNLWWSLNTALMKFEGEVSGKLVDPVANQVTELGGIQNNNLVYENRSLIASMADDHSHEEESTNDAPAYLPRLEQYLFPRKTDSNDIVAKMPPLSYGKKYFLFPYLIGLGGVLPPVLRASDKINELVKAVIDNGKTADHAKRFYDKIPEKQTLTTIYQRQTPIGMPRISPLPVVPETVAPLGREFPILPIAITLSNKKKATTNYSEFFVNELDHSGTLNWAFSKTHKSIQIDFKLDVLESNETLKIYLIGRDDDDNKHEIELLELMGESIEKYVRIIGEQVKDDESVIKQSTLTYYESDSFGDDIGEIEKPRIYINIPDKDNDNINLQIFELNNFKIKIEYTADDDSATIDVCPPIVMFDSVKLNSKVDKKVITTIPLIPPELAHQNRNIILIDGISTGTKFLGPFEINRPTTDFATYERWINYDIAKVESVKKKINKLKGILKNPKTGQSINDPSVCSIIAELVEIFPRVKTRITARITDELIALDDIIDFNDLKDLKGDINKEKIQFVSTDGDADIRKSGKLTTISLKKGYIYELRLYAAIPESQKLGGNLVDVDVMGRISRPVKATLRKIMVTGIDGNPFDVWCGTPHVITCEVTTSAIAKDSADMIYLNEPERTLANSNLGDSINISFEQGYADKNYINLRYMQSAELFSQQWGWRGRSVPEVVLDKEVLKSNYVDKMFAGRRDDDIGPIDKKTLTLSHVYAKSKSEPESNLSFLYSKSLEYKGGANIWRYMLKLTSRYASLHPSRGAMVTYSFTKENKNNNKHWKNLLKEERDTGIEIKRPAIDLVLPLTDNYLDCTTVPPILLLMSGGMFENGDISDNMEAVIDLVRHPFPDTNSNLDDPKFWPEFGPDPIRTGDGHKNASPIPLRVDGPLGYSHDIGTEAPKTNNTGLIITPVVTKDENSDDIIKPWSFLKLKLRRLKTIETSLYVGKSLEDKEYPLWRNFNEENINKVDIKRTGFYNTYEGLILDLLKINTSVVSIIENLNTNGSAQATVEITKSGDKISLAMNTNLGKLGEWSTPLKIDEEIPQIHLIISQRQRPSETGPYKPLVDVSVRVKTTKKNELLDKWVTVTSLPVSFLNEIEPNNPPEVKITPNNLQAKIYPARMSGYSPEVWCQLGQDFSQFLYIKEKKPAKKIMISDMTVSVSEEGVEFQTNKEPISLQTYGSTSEGQLETVLAAVVTQYVKDINNQLVEEPITIFEQKNGKFNNPTWHNTDHSKPNLTTNSSGRVRIYTLIRLKAGIQGTAAEFPSHYFNDDSSVSDMNPLDAKGMNLGISKPIEWS